TVSTGGNATGNACVEFIVPANGTSNNGIWAKFQYTTSCQDEDKYHSPYECLPPPPCELDIYKVEVGQCYFDHNDYKSKVKVKVCVSWKNAPVGEKIFVLVEGQYRYIVPNYTTGSTCVEFIVLADGSQYNGVWAKFEYDDYCQDEAYYNAPYACIPPPVCDLDIYKVEVGECYYDNGQSKAKLKVCVNWKNRPGSENIIVSINGQNKTISTGNNTNGSGCVEFIVLANGTSNNGIWAKFQYTTSCQDEDKYHTPYACIPPPVCDLDIYKVEVGECYYDNGQSKAKLKVCVNWKNRPGSENIIVSINGQNKTISTGNNTNGNGCIEFIVPANGTSGNGIWAKFQSTTSCQDEDKYHTPNACQPIPPCYLDIKKVEVSECNADPNTFISTATLKVCVNWNNVPAGNKIEVSIIGQSKTFEPEERSGEYCVYFTVPANGIKNNGIWAKLVQSNTCFDEAFFDAPLPCRPVTCNCELPTNRDTIIVKFSEDCKSVCICSTKEISNLVFDFGAGCFQNFDTDIKKNSSDLSGSLKKQFFYFNQPINGVWVKAGNNNCSDNPSNRGCEDGSGQPCCPGCGEYFECDDDDYEDRSAIESSNIEEAHVLPLFENAKVKTEDVEVAKEVKVFPNPTSNELYVELAGFAGKAANIQIFNTIGQLMSQTQIDEIGKEPIRFDVSKLTSEMYFLKVHIPNEGVITKKFIVRKQ
ncbi:MAG: T9SS type A sorting domain-containing protein, partial [Saprospiraceae bacterium]|nr:T9SS type A sorting domain-containing protein [Saprospiraceae bacterium]